MEHIVFELSVILITTATLCTFAELTKQPLIPAYILAGLFLGQSGLGVIESSEIFTAISEVGIVLLLYLIGLELKPHYFIKTFSRTSLITIGAAAGTALFGVLLSILTPIPNIQILYLTIALFFSSTVVVMRTLLEEKQVGQNVFDGCLGILLFQDIIAILVLLILNSQQQSGSFEFFAIFQFIFYGFGVILLSWFLQKWLLKVVVRRIAPSSNVIFLIGLAWCFFFAELAEVLHLSREIGAFIAGLSITSLSERKQHIFVEKSGIIRDFFMILFFFMLGANFMITEWANALPIIAIGIVFAIAIKPVIFYALSRRFKYSPLQSQEIGVRLGQISEFSIIVVLFGVKIGHINNEFANIIQLVLFVTIIISRYLVHYGVTKWTRMLVEEQPSQ